MRGGSGRFPSSAFRRLFIQRWIPYSGIPIICKAFTRKCLSQSTSPGRRARAGLLSRSGLSFWMQMTSDPSGSSPAIFTQVGIVGAGSWVGTRLPSPSGRRWRATARRMRGLRRRRIVSTLLSAAVFGAPSAARLAARPLIRPRHSPSKDGRLTTPYGAATFSQREKGGGRLQDV
jgi:hypothetical protein